MKSACCRSVVFSDTWLGGSFFLECLLLIVVFVFGATAIFFFLKATVKVCFCAVENYSCDKYKLNHLTKMNSFSYHRDILYQFLCVMSFFGRILYMLSKLLIFVQLFNMFLFKSNQILTYLILKINKFWSSQQDHLILNLI